MQDSHFKTWGIFILLFLCCSITFSQFNNFKKWSVKDGLLQSDIYDIRQDSRGYIWIASGGGVSVFDGLQFKHYTKSNGLAGNVVRSIYEDSKGRIWFGTNEGVCYNDGLNFHPLQNKDFKGSVALSFAEDKNQTLYIGTDDGGINILKFEGDSIIVKNINETNGLSANSVFDIAIDDDQRVWLATYGGGINILRGENALTYTVVNGPTKLPSDLLLSIEIKGDEVWLGSHDAGAFKFSRKNILNSNFESPLIFDSKTGLNSNYIWDILITKDNKVWLASAEKGINRLEKTNSIYQNISFTDRNGLSDNQVLSLFEDQQRNIWIGTNGNGLNMLTGDHFSHYGTNDGLPSNKVQAIQQDTNNNYWLACSGAGLVKLNFINNTPVIQNYFDKGGLTNFISSIAIGKGSNKNIWFGTDNNGIVKFNGSKFFNYTERDGLINNRIYSIYVDGKGIVWSGTADGISRFDGVKFLNISTDKMKMQNEGVKTITADKKGGIWFGTSGGLARYKGVGDLRTFDEVEGLIAKDVNAITARSNGDIYIGTNTGGIYKYNHLKNDSNAIEFVVDDSLLSSNSIRSMQFIDDNTLISGTFKGFDKIIFDTQNCIKQVKHYGVLDGFTGLECNDNAILLDQSKNIWFGTVNGISKYSVSLDNKVSVPPIVYITDLKLFFKEVKWDTKQVNRLDWFNVPTELTLPYYENHLTFQFHANNFSNPENVVYRLKLGGRDESWTPERKNSEETFSGIEPGTYTFVVSAKLVGTENWSEPATFQFVITPPWYRTKTFYFLVILTIVLSVYSYIKWRERKLIKEKEILENTVKERTHEVEVQKEHLSEKNKEITDSINYAKGIQSAMLPPISDIHKAWNDLFVFFQPKDIVSGDFYWFKQISDNEFLIACADCTGHGVPGGFMSMVCSGELHDASKESNEPSKILQRTNNEVKRALRQRTDVQGKNKDGMEVCLLRINTATFEVSYCGANRLLWVVDGSTMELTEIKPTKASIASFTEFDFEYQQVDLKLKKGDLLYTTSDGYPDQFGGPEGKKYMSKNLKNLIVQNCQMPMQKQLDFFKNDVNTWMRDCEQVDDLLLIGIRL